MLDAKHNALIAVAGDMDINLLPNMANRHGLVCGATGTGKSVTLQTLAETFSALGVPVFMADVKGDLSGCGAPGAAHGKVAERAKSLGLVKKGYKNRAFPVCFWDIFGRDGHPMRATVSEIGPVLLARLLGLNEVQGGVLQMAFRIADDNGLLLLDLKDLKSLLTFLCDERENLLPQYGQFTTASVGAIQRALLRLEAEGGEKFFGEPAFDVENLLRVAPDGQGIINILTADALINAPQLYSCVLLWLLSELFERLPEVGDREKPRLVFFFDEAHLLFRDIPQVLLQKIEQVARLIRSRGVGIYFVTQIPSDVPDSILGQLGNRVQHGLRAFTPKDQKAVRAAAQAFRPNPAFAAADVIGQLGVGEALVSFLDASGAPAIVQRALIAPPEGQVGPLDKEQRREIIAASPYAGVYDEAVDRESAYEVLTARAFMRLAEDGAAKRNAALEREEKERRKLETERQKAEARARKNAPPTAADLLGSILKKTATSVTSQVGREIGKSLLRGVLGSLVGGKRR